MHKSKQRINSCTKGMILVQELVQPMQEQNLISVEVVVAVVQVMEWEVEWAVAWEVVVSRTMTIQEVDK